MSIGTVRKIECAADLEGLDANLTLVARAAIGAGYKVELRSLRFQDMLFVDNKHFYPLNCWEQCVRLIVDTGSVFEINPNGLVRISGARAGGGAEVRTPTTDAEYRKQMCEAVVTNIAKACPF